MAGLRGLLDEARTATDGGDFARVAVLNSALHQRVIDVGGNAWLSAITGSLYRHVQWVFRLTAAHRAPHSWTEHVRLVEAIAAHDAATAEQAASTHVAAAAAASLLRNGDGRADDGPGNDDGGLRDDDERGDVPASPRPPRSVGRDA